MIHFAIGQCPILPNPANGMVETTDDRLSGSTATYTCNSGFDLITTGSNVRTCQPDGMWSGSEPQCLGTLLVVIITATHV